MLITEGVEPCTYCGVTADSIDHIPSQCMREKLLALGKYQGVWKEVPACRWCNSVLGRLALLTIDDRRQHIKATIRRKFKRLLAAPMWSESDLAELGDGLQGYMRENMEHSRVLRARLAWEGQSRVKESGQPMTLDSTKRQPGPLKRHSRPTFAGHHPEVEFSHFQIGDTSRSIEQNILAKEYRWLGQDRRVGKQKDRRIGKVEKREASSFWNESYRSVARGYEHRHTGY